ncbi:MAG TPA: helix-turn-helix domain-containing protein [Alphaproteobacteria bacterium]|nr:helix-turn-helix domain-containing protein [Alphaproteobacteria bacterium]
MYAHAAAAAVLAAAPVFNRGASAIFQGTERMGAVRMGAAGTVQKLESGKTLFAEGDDAENVYELMSGMVKLFKLLPDGRRQITGFLWSGDIMGVAHSELYLYGAEAITDVVLCRYPRARFDDLVDQVPGLGRRVLKVIARELSAAQEQMLLLGRKTAVEKIASFLLDMAERQLEQLETRGCVLVPMGRSDIADYLGLTTETVSRTLTKLKQDHVIALPSPARVTVENRDRLAELAAGDGDEDF